mgnify:CR=1 FL=1
MAKRKKRNTKEKDNHFLIQLWGVLLILISILGIGKYGPAGRIISSFALFLVGNLYLLLLVAVLFLGIYMVVKDEKFNFFSAKMMGIYLMIISALVFLHISYCLENIDTSKIISETYENLLVGIDKIMGNEIKTGVFNPALENTGGGIIGSLFATAFYKLFEKDGANIVCWVFLITGFMVFTGMSIFDIVRSTKDKVKEMIPKKDKESIKDKKHENKFDETKLKINTNDEDEETPKKVVKNISEITNINAEKKIEPEVKEEKEEVVVNKNYTLPSFDLLDSPQKNKKVIDKVAIANNSKKLVETLRDFGIIGEVVAVNVGPSVIQYELELSQGTKLSKLLGINREIALALAKKDVRIQAPIPGKNTVGIEMPNDNAQTVTLRETLEGLKRENKLKTKLTAGLGKDIAGKTVFCDIAKMPHLLIAGTTGSGKSVCMNSIIVSILYRANPEEVKFLMIDPKKVEFSKYENIPHLLVPVVTDPRKASGALGWAVSEMLERYQKFSDTGVRDIEGYNRYVEKHEDMKPMPKIVICIDELADLMMAAPKEVEDSICRLAQMARAAGMHLVIATQRPSVDVITGLIKANISSRIALTVYFNFS